MSSNMKLIVGLGNPGIKYKNNRHNIGYSVVSALLKDLNAPEMSSKFKSRFIGVNMDGEKTILLMPETYMNNSGQAVREVVDYYKIEPNNILVIVDDKDLKLGKIRIKSKGSSGGQNGVKSIIQHLGHENFNRMKIGFGFPTPIFILLKFSCPRCWIIDLTPFCPPEDPVDLILIFPISKSLSSTITKILFGSIL